MGGPPCARQNGFLSNGLSISFGRPLPDPLGVPERVPGGWLLHFHFGGEPPLSRALTCPLDQPAISGVNNKQDYRCRGRVARGCSRVSLIFISARIKFGDFRPPL